MKTGLELVAEIDACRLGRGECAFWWLGQQSYVVKLGTDVVYLDPYLSPVRSRRVAPLLEPSQLSHAAAVLGSHDHSDHIDRPVWPAIAAAASGARFVVPERLRERVGAELGLAPGRVLGVDLGRAVTVGGVRIAAVPAAHELLDRDPATGLHACVSFIVQGNGCTVFHAGDTCCYDGQQALLRPWRFDAVFLPINGRDAQRYSRNCIGNMTWQEAADLAGALAPGLTVPGHFEMFAGNSADPAPFVDYMRVKYPGLRVCVPEHGVCVRCGGAA